MEKEDAGKEAEDVDLMTEDWAFNVTLLKIARKITPDELKMMKYATKGSNGLGKAVLEKIKDPTDLFGIMQDRGFLDPNNLLHLQAILWAIERKDLCCALAEFARNDRKRPLHFFASKEKPENGYTFLKIHIDGTNVSKQDVKNLRNLVAELLLTPVEYVYFVGYEPSSSIIVTFMVPMDNTKELKSLSEEDRGLLKSMHVDYIFIGEEEVSIIGEKYKRPVTLSSINEITKFMREKKRLERELQESLVLASQRHRALKEMQQKYVFLERACKQQAFVLSYCLFELTPKQLPADLMAHESVLKYFRKTLHVFLESYPNGRDEVYVLLEAKELITRKLERQKWRAFSTAQLLSQYANQTTMGIDYATHIEQLHKSTSGKLPASLVEEPYPWQNLKIHQTVLEMPAFPFLLQPPPQPLVPPKSPNQVSTNQAPHTSHFEYNSGLPQKSFDQFVFKGVKKGSQNIKPPGQIAKESTARPTGPLASPHQQMDFSLREQQSASECIMQFMKDASSELNEAQRKSLLDQTELKSDRREDVQKHPEILFHVLYEDEHSTASEQEDKLTFVWRKTESLSHPELSERIDSLLRKAGQELNNIQLSSPRSQQAPISTYAELT